MVPKGVIWGGAVDGSNQVGAIVTCQAMITSPAGDAWPFASWIAPDVRTRTVSNTAKARREDHIFNPPVKGLFSTCSRCREDGLKARLPSRVPLDFTPCAWEVRGTRGRCLPFV